MTDDRDLSWESFSQDLEADMQQEGQRASRKPASTTLHKTLASALEQDERAIERTIKAIDTVVGQLHEVADCPQARSAGAAPTGTASLAARPAPAAGPVTEAANAAPAAAPTSQVAAIGKKEAAATRPAPAMVEKQPAETAGPVQQATTPTSLARGASNAMHPTAASTPAGKPIAGPALTVDKADLASWPQPAARAHQPSLNTSATATMRGPAVPKPQAAPVQSAQGAKSAPRPERQDAPSTPTAAKEQPALEQAAGPDLKKASPAGAQSAPSEPKLANPDAGPRGRVEPQTKAAPEIPAKPLVCEMKDVPKAAPGMVTIEGDTGPIKARQPHHGGSPPGGVDDNGRRGGGGGGGGFHKRLGPVDFGAALKAGLGAVRKNLLIVMMFTVACNMLVLAIPIYLFQISDRVLTSRSGDTLIMLTVVIVGAVVLQAVFDALRRFILMRTAVEVAAQLGAPILSAAARASLNSNGKEYQVLGDLQQLRTFLTSGTLLSFLDAPMAPVMMLAVFLIHPHQGFIVATSALLLLIITLLNQRATAVIFSEANAHQSKANIHLDSMSRNSQIINALAMIPEAVKIWGKDTANSLRAQVIAQDRNIVFASLSKAVRLLTQVTMLGWGAHLAIDGHLTGGMVIAASIIAGRALGPIEGAIEGWNHVVHARAAYGRISSLLQSSPLNFERLNLPRPEGRLDVERLLFVPQGTKRVVLNGISFALSPGDSLAIIGNSGAGKTTLGKMLVGSILPTSGNVRLDLMDLRNWDPRQFGENIGYLPQDVQLFPASIKANIARMRDDATDADIYQAAALADVHEMISTLPHGYETFVAADGAPLSGGQKQRVALARAFFGNPRLVVLDEPNSNLDAAGDAALERALQHAKENKITVITITQRPSLLKSVDKILLLVNGTVALFGMRQDVLQALANRGLSIEGGSFGHQIQ
ncbi:MULTISPECIES: type I secretion system permease/ATPase [unclassified Mesorhizobium]|uniref:type I secretion system permease/ATPase n=1 Tax=unclassified Mesorhizobium TaxID=325217 RepID=UPI000BB09818|nr:MULTISPECIES: type I secretion system permease/ATPase [unclassified Mesorhizobium]AZO09633.1 type I secretion system permease/ATPase [Mesorhizobium sp. M3A.F.Ca.ET.080.04.2.1]PBB83671.1 type I secretion system permease/ATPase [Mesorhizobium sp. WSM3876]TGT57636.1 type I secretion system permease/ATPase [Mesorhizobium sp. M00.F.Ca.ET.170.01.1.1]